MGLELLKDAAACGSGSVAVGLSESALRFHLEYLAPADLSVEQDRLQKLLGAGGFSLRPLPGDEDPALLLLEFGGIDRAQSSELLFTEAAELTDALGLISCVPEVDPGYWGLDEAGAADPESAGKLVEKYCLSKLEPPTDRHWSVKAVRADLAWAAGARGQGIVIGQPDTGVADHTEIALGLDLARGIDLVAGSGPPTDPLRNRIGNPGHGTATSSVAISRPTGQVFGAAPEATLVPVRCVEAVVLVGGAATAAAIDHARLKGCDIVTMSLGGPLEFPALRSAIRRAVDAGMIVLAAAGNCVGLVVYPAWDPNVIAVAAINQHDQRWTGSSHGQAVDIAAPGEHVWLARRSKPDDPDLGVVEPGEGTSFAVATTAGVVALWLSHHGRAAVRQAAADKGISVYALCRAALRQSARKPVGWPGEMGAGIVDAKALIDLPLADIVPQAPKRGGNPARALLSGVFDWSRFAPEAGFLAFDAAQRASPERIDARESPVIPHPSPQLAAELAKAGRSERFAGPALVSAPLTVRATPRAALLALAGERPGGARGATESIGGLTESTAREWIGADGKDELVGLARQTLGVLSPDDDARGETASLRREVIAATPELLDRLAAGSRAEDLDPLARFTLESLIRMTGRPVLRMEGDDFDAATQGEVGEWAPLLLGTANRTWLSPLVKAIGRIDRLDEGQVVHLGTGTLVAENVVMTNRHVLDAFADPLPSGGFKLRRPAYIDFDDNPADPSRRFPIIGVLGAGARRIGMRVDLSRLDIAFVAIGRAEGRTAPAPLGAARIDDMPSDAMNRIAVVGYPAPPGSNAVVDPATQRVSLEMIDRLAALFQNRYGVKYLSPGVIDAKVGEVTGDPQGWAFAHDATTLGGNSGSPVLAFESMRLCGIHFGGMPLRQNLAHGLAKVNEVIAAHPDLAAGTLEPGWFGR